MAAELLSTSFAIWEGAFGSNTYICWLAISETMDVLFFEWSSTFCYL